MTGPTSITKSLPWLLAAAVGLGFGQGHYPFGAALVVGMACAVRFFRVSPVGFGALAFVVVHALVWEWAYRGMAPMPLAGRLGLEAGTGILVVLCLLLDRRVCRAGSSFWTTLAFPCALVAYDFLNARLSPGASWGSLAYTFVDDAVVAQSASLFGWVTLTFLVAWIASSVNWAWDVGFGEQRAWSAMGSVGGVIALTLAYGAVRLAPHPDLPPPTPVACIVAPNTYALDRVNEVWAYTRGVDEGAESRRFGIERIAASLDEHVAMTEAAAARGARVVLWPEVSTSLTEAEVDAWTARVAEVARTHGVYVGMGLMIFRPESGKPSMNAYRLLDPAGDVVVDFLKAKRTPGNQHVVGDGILPELVAPFGRVATAICFDLDFPQLIAQAGAMQADVLFAPSNDWLEARATHARMARMRAIEQGVVLVRPTKDGVSLVADPNGRVRASLVLEDRETGTLVADVAMRAAPTLYGRIGDVFAWACVVGLALFVAIAVRRRSAAGPDTARGCDRRDGKQWKSK